MRKYVGLSYFSGPQRRIINPVSVIEQRKLWRREEKNRQEVEKLKRKQPTRVLPAWKHNNWINHLSNIFPIILPLINYSGVFPTTACSGARLKLVWNSSQMIVNAQWITRRLPWITAKRKSSPQLLGSPAPPLHSRPPMWWNYISFTMSIFQYIFLQENKGEKHGFIGNYVKLTGGHSSSLLCPSTWTHRAGLLFTVQSGSS